MGAADDHAGAALAAGAHDVVVADSSYAVLELLSAATTLLTPVIMSTRLRMDAALYDPAPLLEVTFEETRAIWGWKRNGSGRIW